MTSTFLSPQPSKRTYHIDAPLWNNFSKVIRDVCTCVEDLCNYDGCSTCEEYCNVQADDPVPDTSMDIDQKGISLIEVAMTEI